MDIPRTLHPGANTKVRLKKEAAADRYTLRDHNITQ